MCSISVCSFELIQVSRFIVWKVWPEQIFKVKSWVFQKSRADNFRMQTATQILRVTYRTRHQGDSLWLVSNNSNGNWRRTCAHMKLLTDRRTDKWGYNIIRPLGHIKILSWESLPIPNFYPRNMMKIIALSFLLLSTEFHTSRQCRVKIRLHVLCSLILIYSVCRGNYSRQRHFKGYRHFQIYK